jgi:hypothetical protein
MKLLTPAFLFSLVLALLAPAGLQAQSGNGVVTGRVADAATRLALGGVRVSVTGTPLETYSAGDGDFVLLNVPAGPQTLVFNYVGYPEITRQVTVEAGRTVTEDVSFGSEVAGRLCDRGIARRHRARDQRAARGGYAAQYRGRR